ncbi:PREDICTED: uncharacterized protein LOC109180335 [Ipomoea nil]|uniref:uncharacterized protein LOC109180335 n=1 Tax=Ipomoea nil TaxID=35883 RepID=UPI0009010712|nr:PREDICTED: uncharacterized protein LOC109180335 [Ipomoea nil]
MGSSQSIEVASDDEEQVEEGVGQDERRDLGHDSLVKKVLEQEPEILPCHASASPLSPQLSSFGTPRLLGPSIKVWDPYNVLAPPLPPHFHHTFSTQDDDTVTEVFLICNGECHMKLRPDLIAGRCPEASLTPNGKRQARALAVFLKSQGVRFNAVYTSPLDRARATALSVCQELNFLEEQIQSSDALVEMSLGHWEGCNQSEIFTSETMRLIERFQPDFTAPSGESLRQVEFRMVQFLNRTVMASHEKFRPDFSMSDQIESFPNRGSHALTNSVHDSRDGPSFSSPQWDLVYRHRQGLPRKKSGKSRLQIVTKTGDQEADDEMSPREAVNPNSIGDISMRSALCCVSSRVAVISHSIPIKCLLTGVLGCSAEMSSKLCIEDSSVSVLQHSWKMGWQIKRLNDTTHLRLL